MAGDWIKMTKGLETAPEVIRLSSFLSLPRDDILGKLFRFWSWADTHLLDGDAASVTEAFVDELAGVSQFASALASVGWLEPLNGDWQEGFHIPRFGRHMGQSAKQRALAAERNREYRKRAIRERDAGSVTGASRKASPEKRREEIPPQAPPGGRRRSRANVPEGHPCHGRRKGEKWKDGDVEHAIDESGWWWVRQPDSEPVRKEKVL